MTFSVSEKLPWYAALATVPIATAASMLGLLMPKAVDSTNTDQLVNVIPQCLAYLLTLGATAFFLAQQHLEKGRLAGYAKNGSFITLFAFAYALVALFGGYLFLDLARGLQEALVYDWPSGDLSRAWERKQVAMTVIRVAAPVVAVLLVFAAWKFSVFFFNGPRVRAVSVSARRTRAAGMFACVVTAASLLMEGISPTLTPTRFIWAHEVPLRPLYATVSILLWTTLPVFLIARYVARRDLAATRPGRIVLFGLGTMLVIQFLRFAVMFGGWVPLVTAVDEAGHLPAFAAFPEAHPLWTLAIVYALHIPLTVSVTWMMAWPAFGGRIRR